MRRWFPDVTDFYDEAQRDEADARAAKPHHPQGWEPGIAWDGRGGTITSRPLAEPTPDWDALLRIWGFDPATVQVIEPVQVRTWDAAIGDGQVRTMWYYRAGIKAKRPGAVGIDDLLPLVKRGRKRTTPTHSAGGSAGSVADGDTYLLALSDWQLGKRGTPATVDRIVAAIDASRERLRWLQRRRPITRVALPCLGDLGESCDGFYAMQTFEVELDGREQARLGRRLLLYAIDRHRDLVDRVIVPAVPGNHGEKRKDGKAFTTFGDNVDLEIPEGVAEACAMNPTAYGHVSFVIPNERLTLTLDLSGTIVGFAHGHQAKRGGTTAQQKVATWWSGQAFGQRSIGDASLLFTGHNHHGSMVEHGPRWHIQVGAMDSGSQWWDETTGMATGPGMFTCVVNDKGKRWHDAEVLA